MPPMPVTFLTGSSFFCFDSIELKAKPEQNAVVTATIIRAVFFMIDVLQKQNNKKPG